MPTTSYIPRPHVSAAVKQLRLWVSLSATVFVLAAITQMLVFAFVQYTDVRWTEVRETRTDKPLRVVGGSLSTASAGDHDAPADPAGAQKDAAAGSSTRSKVDEVVVGGVRGRVNETKNAVEINRVKSPMDRVLSRMSAIACGAGVIGAVCLMIFTLMGVVIAGGACIPGVERTVTAGAWSLVLMLLCLPWNAMLPTLGIPGVFVGYDAMTGIVDSRTTEAAELGSLAALAQWVLAPLTAMFASLGVCFWFRAGVEQGVIVTSPSELDKAVEREVEMIAKRGVASTTPKAVGALNRAIGDDAPANGHGVSTLSAVERAIEEAAKTASSMVDDASMTPKPRRPRTVADADFKRPI